MINHLRTLLYNRRLSTVDDMRAFHLDSEFYSFNYPAAIYDVWRVLFPPTSSDAEKAEQNEHYDLIHAYLSLLAATGLEDALDFVDSRRTYRLNYLAPTFLEESTVAVTIKDKYTKLWANKPIVDALFKLPSSVDVKSYDRLWWEHYNWAYSLGGMVVSLAYRMDWKRKNG